MPGYETYLDVPRITGLVGRGTIPSWCWEAADWEDLQSDAITEAEFVVKLRELVPKRRPQRPRVDGIDLPELDAFTVANSRVTAHLASTDRSVIRFRTRFLADGLIDPREIAEWIANQLGEDMPAEFQGNADRWVTAERMNNDGTVWIDVPVVTAPIGELARGELRQMEVPRDSVVGNLAELVGRIAAVYRWEPVEALIFLFADEVPPVRPARVVAIQQMGDGESDPLRALLHIAIDPLVNPKQLARWYATVRRQLLTGRFELPDEKTLKLTEFVLTDDTRSTWRERLEKWNRLPGLPRAWKRSPSSWRNFQRDATRARRRFMQPPLRSDLDGRSEEDG